MRVKVTHLFLQCRNNVVDIIRGGQMGAKEPIVAPPGLFVALG